VVGRGDPRPAFARGVERARRRDWSGAAHAFRTAAALAPRASDAWGNAGTAAWLAGDTVSAAVGWHRALRLDPRDAGVRERLALLPAPSDGWIAGVPAVPADWATGAALVSLWLAAITLPGLLVGRARVRTLARAVAPRALALTLLFSGAAAWLTTTQRTADRAVVRDAGPLRAEPSLGADAVGQTTPTDLARVAAEQAAWTRVVLEGEREGWIESARLVRLRE
jgi:hypothetical protein